MNRNLILTLFIIFSSCKKNEDSDLLYNQLINYRDDLKMTIMNQEIYLSRESQKNEFYRKRFDSLNRINTELDKSFERLRYGDRKDLLELRDNFNLQYKLHFKFDSAENYKNINDSIFNRLIETDILKLRKQFQNYYMFLHGDKFE